MKPLRSEMLTHAVLINQALTEVCWKEKTHCLKTPLIWTKFGGSRNISSASPAWPWGNVEKERQDENIGVPCLPWMGHLAFVQILLAGSDNYLPFIIVSLSKGAKSLLTIFLFEREGHLSSQCRQQSGEKMAFTHESFLFWNAFILMTWWKSHYGCRCCKLKNLHKHCLYSHSPPWGNHH